MGTSELTAEIFQKLGQPFPEGEVEFLPRNPKNGRALALAYIDARSVMNRLDAVVGPGNWAWDYDVLAPTGKLVKGKLTVCGVMKCDAGEADKEDEPLKSAVSDALKRCAVHFGIGRYLYYLPQIWAPYDESKRRFAEAPRINPTEVARALSLCGVKVDGAAPRPHGGQSRPPAASAAGAPAASNGAATRAPASSSPSPSPSPAGEPPKSIWAATSPSLESSGDRAVTTGAVERQERPASTLIATGRGSDADRAGLIGAIQASQAAGRMSDPQLLDFATATLREEVRDFDLLSFADLTRVSEALAAHVAAKQPAVPPPAGNGALICSGPGCGKALTKGQHDVSVRAYGQPLCPGCQKAHARLAA